MDPRSWELVYAGAVARWEAERRVDAWKIHAHTLHRVKSSDRSRYTPEAIYAGAPAMLPAWILEGKPR